MNIKYINEEENNIMSHSFEGKNLPKKIAEYLLSDGFNVIGNGQFGTVYASPNKDYVVKVNNGLYDGAYLDFARWCAKQNNKHLPKIGNIKNFGEKSYFVFIEKLEEVDLKVKDISKFSLVLKNILKEICKGRKSWSDFIFDHIMPLLTEEDENIAQQILECLIVLEKYVQYNSIDIDDEMDLHPGNFMRRGYFLVIADPVS